MTTLDHLVLAVPALEPAMASMGAAWGCPVVPGGHHPRWGSWNALVPLKGGAYLEIIAPHPDPPATVGRVFGLDDVRSPSLTTWAVRTGGRMELPALARLASEHGVDVGDFLHGSRRRPDGALLEWTLSDPFAHRMSGAVPFLIDWGTTPHPSTAGEAVVELEALRIGHPEAARVRRILAAWEVDGPVSVHDAAGPEIRAALRTPRGAVELLGGARHMEGP